MSWIIVRGVATLGGGGMCAGVCVTGGEITLGGSIAVVHGVSWVWRVDALGAVVMRVGATGGGTSWKIVLTAWRLP